MAMFLLPLLLILNPLNSLLNHPPRDFASLLNPAEMLQAMNVQTSDEALIAVLTAPADPAASDSYVKKLMAIRLLEQNKSAKGLPALAATANDSDVTLRDAALDAIAAINNKPSLRPNGAALLKELARSVPADAGFVVALDFERDSKSQTVRALLENALKEMQAKRTANPPAAANAPADTSAVMMQQFEQAIPAMIPQAEQGLALALASTGNLRVDAAMLILPPEMGTQPNENYMRCLIKGLYDPARIAKLLESTGDFEKREAAGHAVYANKQGEVQICLLDANTFLVVIMNKAEKPGVMESFLSALTAAEKAPPQKALAEAFDMVTERQARLAVAGTLSPSQKKSFVASLVQNLKPTNLQLGPAEQIAFTGSQTLLDIVRAQAYAASLDTQGKLAIHVVCPDAAAAAALDDSSNKLQKALFDMVSKESADVPPPLAMALRDVTKEGCLWKSEVAETTVTIKVDNLLVPIMAMTLGGGFQAHPPAPPEGVPPAAPAEPAQPK
ncbi:MAG: hypothetical protein ACLQVA_07655 [Candidatus Brocadiia bacterium]